MSNTTPTDPALRYRVTVRSGQHSGFDIYDIACMPADPDHWAYGVWDALRSTSDRNIAELYEPDAAKWAKEEPAADAETLTVWHSICGEAITVPVLAEHHPKGEALTGPFYGWIEYDPKTGGTVLQMYVTSSYARRHELAAGVKRPQPGDVVAALTGDYYAAKPGATGYIGRRDELGIEHPNELVGFGISGAHMQPGQPHTLSLSGGPFAQINGDDLVYGSGARFGDI